MDFTLPHNHRTSEKPTLGFECLETRRPQPGHELGEGGEVEGLGSMIAPARPAAADAKTKAATQL
ncbi:MAG: hypothetical protein ABR584_00845, partial [Candidatus Baltobacteraceae bacterium]